MEEAALYRAVLAAPHDDTPRLVLADWLDEHAAALPEPDARSQRGRAELIRVGCALARSGFPWHYGPLRNPALDPELVRRAKRLRFLYSAKLRRGLPEPLASARFDRGFLRPRLAVVPHQFLGAPARPPGLILPRPDPLPLLPPDHPMRRYVPVDDPFDAFPLWDVHLYAPDYAGDPLSDRGQYGEALARCARSPALARVGWLKASFFRTPTLEFFRTGDFANVEALELNCGPFPDVLEAVAGNESFRGLRYVSFGSDHWAWAPNPAVDERRKQIGRKLSDLNARHLPYGAMREALRALLRDLPPPVPPPVAEAPPPPVRGPRARWAAAPTSDPDPDGRLHRLGVTIGVVLCLPLFAVLWADLRSRPVPPAPPPVPKPLEFDPALVQPAKNSPELDALLKRLAAGQPAFPLDLPAPSGLPVAPPPREVTRE